MASNLYPVMAHVMSHVMASHTVMVARCSEYEPFEHNKRQKVDSLARLDRPHVAYGPMGLRPADTNTVG